MAKNHISDLKVAINSLLLRSLRSPNNRVPLLSQIHVRVSSLNEICESIF